jgi:hypothetical protein
MKTKILALGLTCLLILPFMYGQEEQEIDGILEEVILMRLPPKIGVELVTSPVFDVEALAIGLANFEPSQAAWAIFDFAAEYYESDTWYFCLVVVNFDNENHQIKIEMEMRYNKGAIRWWKRWDKTINANTVMLYKFSDMSSKTKDKGVFRLIGRVAGQRTGVNNVVESQVYIY